MRVEKELSKFYVHIALIFITLFLYLLTNKSTGPFFLILLLIEFILFVSIELTQGAKQHGWKKELVDTFVALVLAVALWFALSFFLNSSSPLSAVVSCSMLPNLARGDMVLVQGGDVKAAQLSLNDDEVKSLFGEAIITYNGAETKIKGSLYSYCSFYRTTNPNLCNSFFSGTGEFSERRGPITFNYGKCNLKTSNGILLEPCVKSLSINDKKTLPNFSNDVMIYQPKKGDYYALAGDIIHRAYVKISAGDKTYYLTKGDNNPVFDIQVYDYLRNLGNDPVSSDNVKGKVLLRIPLVGYFKLALSGFFTEPDQCKTELIYDHI